MPLTFKTKELGLAVNRSLKWVGPKDHPSANLLVRHDSDGSCLVSTDGSAYLISRLSSTASLVSQEEKYVIDRDFLAKVVGANAASGSVVLDGQDLVQPRKKGKTPVDPMLVVKADGSSYKRAWVDPEGFRDWRPDAPTETVRIRASDLARAIYQTAFSVDTKSTRYALGSIQLECEVADQCLELISTDGRRMSVATCLADIDKPFTFKLPVTIAKKVASLAKADAMDDEAANVSLSLTRSPRDHEMLSIEGATWRIGAAEQEGRFPHWKDVLPTSNDIAARFTWYDAAQLGRAVELGGLLANDVNRGIAWHVRGGDLILAADVPDMGASTVYLPPSESDIKTRPIVMIDHRYMQEPLSVIPPGQSVTLTIRDNKNAVLIETAEYRHVIQPLSIDDKPPMPIFERAS